GLADSPAHPHSSGNYHKGTLTMPLHRGGAVAWETFFPALPSNCEGEMVVTISWDEEENVVNIHLQGEHVLFPHPSIHRTRGVNFLPNPFSLEPQSYDNGRYQFWLISPATMITCYYDANTLDFIGTQYEFPTPPPGTIPLMVPGLKLLPTDFYQP